MRSHRSIALLGLALALLCAAAPAPRRPTPAEPVLPAGPPTLHVPPGTQADSVLEAPSGPLLIPGAPAPPDTSAQARATRAREFVREGLAYERSRTPAAAIAAYRNAVMLDPTVPDAYFRMAALFAAVGEDRQAKACLAEELQHHPQNTEAGRLFGLVLARSGDSGRAVSQLELLTRRDPRDAASWAALGFAYTAAGRAKEAEDALRRALRLDPRQSMAHRDLGVLLASQARNDEARAEYARAAALEPRDASVPFNLGNLERRLGHAEPALAAYRKAEALDSTFSFALQGQAQVLLATGREGEAADVYRRWLRVRPDDHNARLDAIRLYQRLGRNDMALELARNGVRAEPRGSDAHLMYGMALGAAGQRREAMVELRRARLLAGDDTGRKNADALMDALRGDAPDSLRAAFAEDSVTLARPPAPKEY